MDLNQFLDEIEKMFVDDPELDFIEFEAFITGGKQRFVVVTREDWDRYY